MTTSEQNDVPEFLNVTLYVEDIADLRAFYHDVLGLPIVYEEPGHITVMGKVAVHDPTEGPANTVRLYFVVDDPEVFAKRATDAGRTGALRTDGYGKPAWESTDPFGNFVVLLKRGRSDDLKAQEYPRRHFEQMAALAEFLRPLPAQVSSHEYSYEGFGSWSLTLRFRGFPFRLTFDGREREYVLSRIGTKEHFLDEPDVLWRRVGGEMDDTWRAELLDALRRDIE